MEQKLQTAIDLVNNNAHLSKDEKLKIIASLKEADEKIKATEFKVEEKNHELEIETALERVRAIALSMKEPANMPEVCRIISHQLALLGVKEIRNVQTAIFYENKGTYMNYEYYAKHDKTFITETSYTNHAIHRDFAEKMLKGNGEFMVAHINGDEVKDWIAYQKTTNVFIDTYLETASSLNYYWFSLGPVALGISTYCALSEDDIKLFKRFLNVFELAYRRYLDIEMALKQAREAQIEASLERLRAAVMAMHKSEELTNICEAMFKELTSLGFSNIRNAQVAIENNEKKTYRVYVYSPFERITGGEFAIDSSPITRSLYKLLGNSSDGFYEKQYSPNEMEEWRAWRKSIAPFNDPREETVSSLCWYMYGVGKGHIGISTFDPIRKEEIEIVKRFKNVFALSYQRFDDLQKAEAQAREAQIEAALERVRSSSLAMHHSNELEQVVVSLFDRLVELGLLFDGAGIYVFEKEKRNIHLWVASKVTVPVKVNLPYDADIEHNPINKDLWNAIETSEDIINRSYSGKVKNNYYRYVGKYNESNIPWSVQKNMLEAESWTASFAAEKNSLVVIDSWTGHLTTDEDFQIVKRFSRVFEQAYTRFLDLQKAEAQTREAQIEAALEKVRSRSLAMHKSDELKEAGELLWNELSKLGIESLSSGYVLMDHEEKIGWIYAPSPANGKIENALGVFHTETKEMQQVLSCWKKQEPMSVVEMNEQETIAHQTFIAEKSLLENRKIAQWITAEQLIALSPKKLFLHNFNFKQGYLMIVGGNRLNEKEIELMLRFTKVFQQTYTRFLDLQKAEAQAREAQIEAALERVRSRSMGMQKSEELKEVIKIVYDQFVHLNINVDHAGFVVDYKPKSDWYFWIADKNVIPSKITTPYFESVWANQFDEAKENGTELFVTHLNFEEKNKFYNKLLSYVPDLPEESKNFYLSCPGLAASTALSDNVSLYIENFSGTPYSDEENKILMRFVKVFQQTYTRFLDLQKAELQAREAQIELGLERVRTRAMVMQHSNELKEVVVTVCEEFRKLDFALNRCTIGTVDDNANSWQEWTVEIDQTTQTYDVKNSGYPYHLELLKNWKQRTEKWIYHLHGDEMKDLTRYLITESGYSHIPKPVQEIMLATPEIFLSHSFQNFGFIRSEGFQPLSEPNLNILFRFAKAFDQAYTRFIDLQKAEAQARESQIEAALERVRSRTLAMQKSDELAETSAVLFQQMINLGIEPNRLYINVIKDENGEAEFWITDEDGSRVSMAYEDNMNNNPTFKKMFDGWKQQKKSLVIDMRDKELKQYFEYLSSIHVPFKGGLAQKRRVQHIAFFSKGFIGMASPEEQPLETLQLLERFAYVFNLTFTRFNDLKIAEANALQAEHDLVEIKAARKKAEETLTELQATQKQLIQSEKMASLGELTAGIAHEIQNPLNFVNNFSEVNRELISELVDEVDKGNTEEAKAIANDIKENSEKINHHGKRADAIVKGMLQHSRSSTGQKEPTDINALCDEYVRLSYHGLRAKDNSFNAKIKTDFDDTIGKINIVPQDIGRVILNLLTNAFYAVNEKQKSHEPSAMSYQPLVTVSTKKSGNQILITVSDNGNGIPQNIVDKIFQPFFTTKPTGSGTGLGLSLSYDIIKAHGGDIKVETKENEGSGFTILLPAV